MPEVRITSSVQWVGAIDWERRLFDELLPLPDGTTYNSYLVRGSEKTALIDTVDPNFTGVLLGNLRENGVKRIDYVVINHAEQDHSGSLAAVLAEYPDSKAVATPKCKAYIVDMLHVPEDRIMTVEDGATVSLGGSELKFIHFPWVHWPETMLTLFAKEGILFPCDMFGSHFAVGDVRNADEAKRHEISKTYFATIMMPFRNVIEPRLPKVQELGLDLIAPSHGPIIREPAKMLAAYRQWISAKPDNLAVIPYVSMHDSTRRMVMHLAGALVARGVKVELFHLADADIAGLATSLVDAATIVVGSPTVLAGLHPKAAYAAFLANALRPKARFATLIGSYEWGGKAAEQLVGMLPNLKVEVLPPVLIKGAPRAEDFAALDRLAGAITEKHASM